MKCKAKTAENVFQPVTFEVTIESLAELITLYARLNCPANIVKERGLDGSRFAEVPEFDYEDDNEFWTEVYNALSAELDKVNS